MARPPPAQSPSGPFTTPEEVWSAGDFARLAGGVALVAEQLCEAVELHARESVLDVATATGNVALAAARRRCRVTGIDLLPALLDRARTRAEAEALAVEFRSANAEELGFPDGAFDCVLSSFGVTFVGRPERAAAEMRRVCRSGGRIGLTAWSEEGFSGPVLALAGRHLPPTSGAAAPLRWSEPAELMRLFDLPAERLRLTPRTVMVRADSVESQIAGLERFLGPIVAARERLAPAGRAELHEQLRALAVRCNRATDGTFYAPSGYVEALLSVP